MDLITTRHLRTRWSSISNAIPLSNQRVFNFSICRSSNFGSCRIFHHDHNISFPFWHNPFPYIPRRFSICSAKKKRSESEPVLKPSIVEEVSMKDDDDDEDELFLDEFGDEEFGDDDDDYLEDEYLEEEPTVGDGSGGGGISLAGTSWDKTALAIAEEVALLFDGELGIYAFRTLLNGSIQVRVERLTNKSGSPSMEDIESFTSAYNARLDEAGVAGTVPDNISLEVSSPGVERVVRIPQDLERFKERAMFVKYVSKVTETGTVSEHDGIFRLICFDLETECCTWGLADVRVNREKAGKGRPLSKKQREWRLETAFDSLLLVRCHTKQ